MCKSGLRITSSKYKLKKKQMNVSSKLTILDGCVILWFIHWRSKGRVEEFMNNVCCCVFKKTTKGKVYLTLDRCYYFIVKSGTNPVQFSQQTTQTQSADSISDRQSSVDRLNLSATY